MLFAVYLRKIEIHRQLTRQINWLSKCIFVLGVDAKDVTTVFWLSLVNFKSFTNSTQPRALKSPMLPLSEEDAICGPFQIKTAQFVTRVTKSMIKMRSLTGGKQMINTDITSKLTMNVF